MPTGIVIGVSALAVVGLTMKLAQAKISLHKPAKTSTVSQVQKRNNVSNATNATDAREPSNEGSSDRNSGQEQASLSLRSRVGIQAFGCGMIPRVGAGITLGDHLVLTDAHVVAGASAIELAINGSATTAVIVHLDPNLDLALLQVNSHFPWAEFERISFGKARKGDQGWVTLLRNERLRPTVVHILRPVKITTEDIYVNGQVTRSGYEIQASTRPGDSGAAVMVQGKVVGLLWSRSQLSEQRAWLTDTSSVASLISTPNLWRIPKDTRCR